MKIYVLNARRTLKYFFLIVLAIVLISIVGITGMDSVGVFSHDRKLPIYSVDCDEKRVAITFDCAWGADDIPKILDTLKNENVKATFFIVGQWAEKFPDTVKLISKEGHDIANHSYSHFRMGSIDKSKVITEITLCREKLEKITGNKVDLFRAPYGDYNNDVINTAKNLGCYTIQWNVDSLDWKPGISRETILSRIMTKVTPGSIILFHNDTPHTAKILPEIISSLKTGGYSFAPVSQLIIREDYIIDNQGKQKRSN